MNENENNDGFVERIVEALNAETSPEWNPAPSWADYVLTWEGLRCLANDLLGRRPYDGRDPLAEPALASAVCEALGEEGFVVLTPARTDRIRRGLDYYGPLCPTHGARHMAALIGVAPGRAECSCCEREALGDLDGVNVYVW